MIRYYSLQPEVPGFGVLQHGNEIMLEVEFPPNDDLLAEDNYFFISDRLRSKLLARNLTGISTRKSKAVLSEQRKIFSPNLTLPIYHLLLAEGRPLAHDFFLSESGELVVSEKALEAMREYALTKCEIREHNP